MENNEQNEEEENIETIHMEKMNDFHINHNYIFRICLLGDSNVGKTSLLTRFCDCTFKESYNNTIGVDFRIVTLKYKDLVIKLHIWDTAGQERFKSIAVNYFKSSHGFIFVYDVTEIETFKNVESWIDLAILNSNNAVLSFLVGNKCDREEERKIDKDKAKEFAKLKNLCFLETSAKNNENVEKLFEYFTYKLIKYFEKNKDKYVDEENNNHINRLSTNFEDINKLQVKEKQCKC